MPRDGAAVALDHPPGPRRLAEWASRSDTPWEAVAVDWSGGHRTLMRVFTRTGLWHRRGPDPIAIRYILSRDPEGEQPDAASFGTEERFLPEAILKYVVQRWSLEVTFAEARAPLASISTAQAPANSHHGIL